MRKILSAAVLSALSLALALPLSAAQEPRLLKIRLSPFFQVEKIQTPLLLLCSGNDVNVPCLNSEQLYQALRRLGRSTELVIYPGQGHGLSRPSFLKDRYERSLAWYDRYLNQKTLKPEAAPQAVAGGGR